MIDFGINKKGRLRCKKTLLILARDYYEHNRRAVFILIPDDLMKQGSINEMEKWKLEKEIYYGYTRKQKTQFGY